MALIVGKYEHVSNSADFADYLKAVGLTSEVLRPVADSRPTITVSEAGGKWTIVVSNAGKESPITFKLGEPYEETMPHGLVFQSVTKRDGNKFITDSSFTDGKQGTRIYEFSEEGINVKLTDAKSGKTASRVYKRV